MNEMNPPLAASHPRILTGDAANVLVKVFRWQEVSKKMRHLQDYWLELAGILASGRYDNAAHQLDVPKLPNNYHRYGWSMGLRPQLVSS